MRKLIVIGIVAAMVMGLAVAASAAIDDYWIVQLKAVNGTITQGTAQYGTKTGYGDGIGLVAEDTKYSASVGGAGEVDCIDLGDNLRWMKDQRAPLGEDAANGTLKIWNLRVGGYQLDAGAITLTAWMPTSAKIDNPVGNTRLTVYLFDGVVTEAQLRAAPELLGTALFMWDETRTGTSALPNKTLSNVSYANGYKAYTLVALGGELPIVPEPGSIIAVLTGLVGLVGLRRRK